MAKGRNFMKRKFAILLLVGLFAFTGCASTNTSQTVSPSKKETMAASSTDYTMDDFGKLLSETEKLFSEETKDFSKDQLYTQEAYDKYVECSKKTGLPVNQEITLHGVKRDFGYSYAYSVASAENDDYYVGCFPTEKENNQFILVPDGKDITVRGVFSKDKDSYGTLSDAYFISGIPYDISYENNVDSIVPSLSTEKSNVIVTGVVREIYDTETFKNTLSTYFPVNDAYNPDHLYLSKTVELGLDDEAESLPVLYFTYNPDVTPEIQVGDKIAVNGEAYDICDMLTADGSVRTNFGVIDMVYNYYKY